MSGYKMSNDAVVLNYTKDKEIIMRQALSIS